MLEAITVRASDELNSADPLKGRGQPLLVLLGGPMNDIVRSATTWIPSGNIARCTCWTNADAVLRMTHLKTPTRSQGSLGMSRILGLRLTMTGSTFSGIPTAVSLLFAILRSRPYPLSRSCSVGAPL